MRLRQSCRLIATFAGFAVLLAGVSLTQETTGGLQGTIKDATGAVVANAHVVVTSSTLVGEKALDTDAAGYYRFANLPPGTYTISVTAKGFKTAKRENITLEVGHLPTVDIPLEVGGADTVVEVTSEAPVIDVTTTRTMTNVTEDVLDTVPHGYSFQSVIQFAPSARQEPLQGNNTAMGRGTGGTSPGNGGNGGSYGFSVGGGADSENSYLVEGQETADLIGGYSHTNVPFDFIQEVQVKSSGIEAEHGGALGGVVNVVMRKGTNNYHGSLFTQFENQGLDGSPTAFSRYNPLDLGTPTSWGALDPAYQNYQPIKPKTSTVYPGFTFGGPILKDRIFGFVGFNPQWQDEERKLYFGPTDGTLPFSRNTQTYYTTARLDAVVTQKLRVYGSWLYQYQRETGESIPTWDSTSNFVNFNSGCFGTSATPCAGPSIPPSAFSHAQGFSAPNSTTNAGADFTINQHLVATSRFGYFFENYHDFGYPQGGATYFWLTNTVGGTDALGNPLPSSFQNLLGWFSGGQTINYTYRNANKAIQFDQDLAWFKSGWKGTHNFKFGYQLNRLSNDIYQTWNQPTINVYGGFSAASAYPPGTPDGAAACAPYVALYGQCQGQYGYIQVYDQGTQGKVTSYNHAFFAQDAWTIGHGITINAGLRVEREYLPGEKFTGQLTPGVPVGNAPAHPIDFGWGDKIAPRIGAAWDVFKDGKMKVFGSYGQFYDQMKLNLAISSFGGQWWQFCSYALNTTDYTSLIPAYNSSNPPRYCVGPTDKYPATWVGGGTPPGISFIENLNYRAFPSTCSTCSQEQEGVMPGLKPYEQHESVFGVDYQLQKNLAFEARWDRRRLDHVIEDSAIYNPQVGETFVIVNPGQGINRTFSSFYDFLYPQNPLTCSAASPCPSGGTNNIIPAARSYDGLELRLTKSTSNHWAGMFAYTYSRFRGNYTGLTSSDISDGGFGGRNSPNNSRAFDEMYFSWNSMGGSSSGLLPTDRPNTFKGYAYYELGWLKKFTSDFGIFQTIYQGAPNTSFADVGYPALGGAPYAPVDVVDRGKWVNVTQDPTTGLVTVGAPTTYRTPWYTQSDFNFQQNYKVSEGKSLTFTATFTNLFNQRAVTALNESINTDYFQQGITIAGAGCGPNGTAGQCYLANGPQFYAAATQPWSLAGNLNSGSLFTGGKPITINSQYGQPLFYQLPRNIRLGVKFSF